MQTFLKALRVFFIILGVIFFLMIISGFYLYQSDFYGIKTIMNYEKESASVPEIDNDVNSNSNEAETEEPNLSPEQEAQLESIGIDPATALSEITPEMEECFVEELGEEKVEAIRAGEPPTVVDMMKIESCL
ncbi:MAG: hypothetical protein ACLFNO_01465 [Parcubacteria group bacterium]